MKFLLIAVSASLMMAQPADSKKDAPTKERVFTEAESLKIENSILRVSALQKEYKIEEYQQKVSPLIKSQQEIIAEACKSIGIAEDKIQSECGFSGFSSDGGTVTGPDGKIVTRKVWHQVPAAIKAK